VEKVIAKQKDFIFKKDKACLNEYLSFKTAKRRREFVKFFTNRFFKLDLKRRGFTTQDEECRLCNKRRKIGSGEDLVHVIKEHLDGKTSIRKKSGKYLDKDMIKIFKKYTFQDFLKTPPREKRNKLSSIKKNE